MEGKKVFLTKQEEMPFLEGVTEGDIKEEQKPLIHYDDLTHMKLEKEIFVPDEDGLIRVKKFELLDPDQGSEDSLKDVGVAILTVSEAKMKPNDSVMSSEIGDKPYCCLQCDYKTKYPNRFKRHKRTCKKSEMFFRCSHCDYKSLKISHLKTHIMAHTNEKPYECPHCDFKAARITNVKRHIMAHHTGEKPHKCSYCDYKTIQYYTLKKHIMAHHTGEKPHHCTHCQYKTLHPNDLKLHIRVHHTGEKPYKCSRCDYKSVRPRDLKRHIELYHARIQADKDGEPKKKAPKRREITDAKRLTRRSAAKINKFPASQTSKAVEVKRQVSKPRSIKVKKSIKSPSANPTAVAKEPKGLSDRSKSPTKAARRNKVVILPSDYPLTQLSHKQYEVLKEAITDKLDEIDETRDDHPSFKGITFKLGGCIVYCDNQTSKTWLSKIISDISIEGGITLRSGETRELVEMARVSSFFPGKNMTEEALLKRLRVQNAKIDGVRSWSLHYMKQMEKGFFAILKIPETSLNSLKAKGMLVGYGLGKVTLKEETMEEILKDPCADIVCDSSSGGQT